MAISDFTNKLKSTPDTDINQFVETLPNVLEISHREFLERKGEPNFAKNVMIPRMKEFNELSQALESSKVSNINKNKYSRYIDMYSASTDAKVFERIKSINAKKETKSFWIQSFNTSIIYKVLKDIEQFQQSLKLMHKMIETDLNTAIERATTPSKAPKDGDAPKDGGATEDGDAKTLSYGNKEKFNKLVNYYKICGKAYKSYYEFHKRFYLKKILIQRIYIDSFNDWMDHLGEDEKSDLYTYYKQFRKDIQAINEKLTHISTEAFNYIETLAQTIDNTAKKVNSIKSLLTDKEQKKLNVMSSVANNVQLQMLNKINALYNNTSAMAVILDNQFTYMYILKVLTYGLQYMGLFFAEKIFSDMYTKAVYVRNKDPPNLLTFYGLYLGFAFAMMMFVIVVLFVLTLIFKEPLNGNLAINNDLIIKYIVDMAIFQVFTGLLLIVVGTLMQKKKYFKYKTEGPRAIRAYSESISIISAITIVMPYFLVV